MTVMAKNNSPRMVALQTHQCGWWARSSMDAVYV